MSKFDVLNSGFSIGTRVRTYVNVVICRQLYGARKRVMLIGREY